MPLLTCPAVPFSAMTLRPALLRCAAHFNVRPFTVVPAAGGNRPGVYAGSRGPTHHSRFASAAASPWPMRNERGNVAANPGMNAGPTIAEKRVVNDPLKRYPRLRICKSAAAEFMAAFAQVAPRVNLRAALRAALLPILRVLNGGLLLAGFDRFRGPQADDPRFVGLLHRALRVDAAQRISRFAADRAEVFRRWRNDDDGLFATHGFPIVEVSLPTGRRWHGEPSKSSQLHSGKKVLTQDRVDPTKLSGSRRKEPTWWSAKSAGERERAGRELKVRAAIASSNQLRLSIAAFGASGQCSAKEPHLNTTFR